MNICIVGASRGLGRALAERCTKDGHTVWGMARSQEELAETEKLCAPGLFHGTVADLLDTHSLHTWQQSIPRVDVIILNASVQLDDMQSGLDTEKVQTVLRTNLEGLLHVVSLFLPDFLIRKQGRIVAIASTAALRPSIRSASYAASKAGLVMAFRTLRMRYADSGVAFQTVTLGPIQTEMWEGKESLLVPSAAKAADAITASIYAEKTIFYYPALSTWLLRLSLFLPDRLFAQLSSTFLK